MFFVRQGPLWFRMTTGVLVLWGLVGCFMCLQQLRLGADAMGQASAYDRALYASLPNWYGPLFAVAVLTGFVGAILLFMRRAYARRFLIASLAATIAQFGWLFASTDIVAHKGASETLGLPVVIIAIAAFTLWLVGHARQKGWAV
ncbi:hypothetical protein HMP09_0170 [Sphingomonas sp. HMP9]|uniref:hypothetical protein n=1 Tax=Sphingomonas sp. HMP9 TaxID=1517554 RepID=UPI001599ABEA|nr:hypothetical protein [Sphingomonas sp. HMP9]BCA60936.1 hypothetical protein HMP09_0170 [Sphingomonas sp. HMP9]